MFWTLHDLVAEHVAQHITLYPLVRFASITINLGPTFLSGGMAANADDQVTEPSCPLVQVNTGELVEDIEKEEVA